MVERTPDKRKVVGSIPTRPILFCSFRLVVRTLLFHGKNVGSILTESIWRTWLKWLKC